MRTDKPQPAEALEVAGPLLRLGALGTVFAAATAALVDTLAVQCTAHNVVAHTWQVLDTATTYQDDTVLLEVVSFARNIGRDLNIVRQAHASHLTQRRIGLFGRSRAYLRANSAFLRVALLHTTRTSGQRILRKAQRRCFFFLRNVLAALADQLVYGRQMSPRF